MIISFNCHAHVAQPGPGCPGLNLCYSRLFLLLPLLVQWRLEGPVPNSGGIGFDASVGFHPSGPWWKTCESFVGGGGIVRGLEPINLGDCPDSGYGKI
jgi:hypothetical protein